MTWPRSYTGRCTARSPDRVEWSGVFAHFTRQSAAISPPNLVLARERAHVSRQKVILH